VTSSGDRAVLFVCGEASGDRIAAGIARALAPARIRCFGMGGAASRAAGVEIVADIRRSAAMGFTEVASRLPRLALSFARLSARVGRERPCAAVLVNYTEYNLLLGRRLRKMGIPVMWCVAPQVWAWRPARTAAVARAVDRMAVILPFEEALWQNAGVDAHYVGHPALDAAQPTKAEARARLALDGDGPFVGLLPGSRAHEVRRLAPVMLASVAVLKKNCPRASARLLAAGSLDPVTLQWLRAEARRAMVDVVDVDAREGALHHLPAFDATLVASGTATLESALVGATPVVAYRLSKMSASLARRLVRTPYVSLPNVILGGAHYPELLQDQAEPQRMARELALVLERRTEFAQKADQLRERLAWPRNGSRAQGGTSAERVAGLLSDWIGPQ
jgi:lipid-A-disaccharide synthase